jgi:hypothetical protein
MSFPLYLGKAMYQPVSSIRLKVNFDCFVTLGPVIAVIHMLHSSDGTAPLTFKCMLRGGGSGLEQPLRTSHQVGWHILLT